MKTIITVICLLVSFTSFSQIITDPEADKFVGTWKWTSGNDEVAITLQKQVFIDPKTGQGIEALVGWHSYTQNGILIESSMQNVGSDVNQDVINSDGRDLITTLRGFTRSPSKVYFITFWDLTLNKGCNLYYTLLPGSTTQATWQLTEVRGIYSGPPGTAGQFTLPQNLTLTKL